MSRGIDRVRVRAMACLPCFLPALLVSCGEGGSSGPFVEREVTEAPDIPTTDAFASPVAAPLDISSTFGPRWKSSGSRYDFHRGINYLGNAGDPILAIGAGTVTGLFPEGSVQFPDGGNTLIVTHALASPFSWQGITVSTSAPGSMRARQRRWTISTTAGSSSSRTSSRARHR